MKQSFTIGKLTLIQDDLGYSVAQENKKEEAEVIASFKHHLDALEYFTKYCFTMAELEAQQATQITHVIKKEKND
jgi:hypothetical protein